VTVTVLIADDQALVRYGLRLIVDAQPDLTVVGEAANGAEAVERAGQLRPNVVLMDIRMPEVDGLQPTRRLMALPTLTATRVLILTTFDLDGYVYDALQAGASGFLLKDTPPEQLVHGIRTVARGDALLGPPSPADSSPTSCAWPDPWTRLRTWPTSPPGSARS
jgi:DNA-binding NarL/FixJ family response regulator